MLRLIFYENPKKVVKSPEAVKAVKDVPVAEEDEVVLAIMPKSDIPVNNAFVPAVIESGENGAEIVPPDNPENSVTSLEDELFKFKVFIGLV